MSRLVLSLVGNGFEGVKAVKEILIHQPVFGLVQMLKWHDTRIVRQQDEFRFDRFHFFRDFGVRHFARP